MAVLSNLPSPHGCSQPGWKLCEQRQLIGHNGFAKAQRALGQSMPDGSFQNEAAGVNISDVTQMKTSVASARKTPGHLVNSTRRPTSLLTLH